MKKILFSAILLSPVFVFAQTANNVAAAEAASLAIYGNVDYITEDGSGHNVNYAFAPPEPTIAVKIHLSTAHPSNLSLKVFDASNNVVKTWVPSSISDIYEPEIDISAIAPGTYKYVIYWDASLVKEISFNKN